MDTIKRLRDNLAKNSIFLPEAILRGVGTSFNEDESLFYIYYANVCFFVLSMYPVNNTILLIQRFDDFDMIARFLFHIVGEYAGLYKMMVLRRNKKLMKKVIDQIVTLQDELNIQKWTQQTIYRANNVVLVFSMSMAVLVITLGITSMIIRIVVSDPTKWFLPFSDIAFINRTYSPNFEIAWTMQTVAVFYACFNFLSPSLLIAALMVDMVVQLELLQYRIRIMIDEERAANDLLNQQEGEASSWFYLHRVLKQIVVEHVQLIDIVGKIEEVGSWMVMTDVVSNLIMIAFCVYYISTIPDATDARVLQILIQLMGITVCLFYISYWGTQLSMQGQAIGTACYTSNFIGSDLRFQNGLRMIMMRSDKPLYVSVGKFTILSVNVFVWILRSSYSFYAVLNKSNEIK